MNVFAESVDSIIPKVKEWRRHLHEYPEASFEEFETTEYIIEQIKDLPGVTYERVAATGVVARLSGDKPGPTIALRADIDALRMPEESGVSFSSKRPGIMHACGHDTHTAMLLGAVHVLAENKKNVSGSFVFIFQAAEEYFPGGAKELVQKGVMDGVDAIIGQHAAPQYNVGHIGVREGYMTANSDCFGITIQGSGGHGSAPENCLDPIPVAAQIVTALQQIVSRQIPAKETAVLTVTQFHAGTADNVIPDTAIIRGTVRTYSEKNRQLIADHIQHIAQAYAEAFGMTAVCEYQTGYNFLYNTPEYTRKLVAAANELYGPDTVIEMDPGMGGEDFSQYLTKAPGCFYFVGMGNDKLGYTYPTHSTKFRIDENAFSIGINIMLNSAMKFQQLVKNIKQEE